MTILRESARLEWIDYILPIISQGYLRISREYLTNQNIPIQITYIGDCKINNILIKPFTIIPNMGVSLSVVNRGGYCYEEI